MELELTDDNIDKLAEEARQKKILDRKNKKLAQLAFGHNGLVIDGQDNCSEDLERLERLKGETYS
jgi:hypothetical protein